MNIKDLATIFSCEEDSIRELIDKLNKGESIIRPEGILNERANKKSPKSRQTRNRSNKNNDVIDNYMNISFTMNYSTWNSSILQDARQFLQLKHSFYHPIYLHESSWSFQFTKEGFLNFVEIICRLIDIFCSGDSVASESIIYFNISS